MKRILGVGGVFLTMQGVIFPLSVSAKEAVQRALYTGEKYRDPTASPLAITAQPAHEVGPIRLPSLSVQGIIWAEGGPRAIVNEHIVKKGDFVEGVEILEITQKGIRVFF